MKKAKKCKFGQKLHRCQKNWKNRKKFFFHLGQTKYKKRIRVNFWTKGFLLLNLAFNKKSTPFLPFLDENDVKIT